MHGINGVWGLMRSNNANKGEPGISLVAPYKWSYYINKIKNQNVLM